MITKILKPTKENINLCGEILQKGGLVAFPTETVYGLGANALDEIAVAKVYEAKGRPKDNPMIVHISDIEDVDLLVQDINSDAKTLMDHFWPGPLTVVLKAKDIVPKRTRGGLPTVAIRMPENKIALDLIRASRVPIAAPSANLSGRPSPTSAEHVIEDLEGRIDAVLVGDSCQIGVESTVIDVSGDKIIVLRPGKISPEDIAKVMGKKVDVDKTILNPVDEILKPKSPGMKYRHYAPKAPMIILQGSKENVQKEIEIQKNKFRGKIGIIMFDEENPENAAKNLYKKLRDMDRQEVDLILAGAIDTKGIGLAVMNRMLKSAAHQVKKV